jgi:D-aminopeptidase
MRVLVMSDMEGVSGIVAHRGEQVEGGAPMYQEGRRLTPIR